MDGALSTWRHKDWGAGAGEVGGSEGTEPWVKCCKEKRDGRCQTPLRGQIRWELRSDTGSGNVEVNSARAVGE